MATFRRRDILLKALPKLTYANLVSTLALFLALGGGAAYAANKIHSGDIANNAVRSKNIAPGAVDTNKTFKRAIISGKLAKGAVRSNQIADRAVDSTRSIPAPSAQFSSPTGRSARRRSGPARSLPLTSSSRCSSSPAPAGAPRRSAKNRAPIR